MKKILTTLIALLFGITLTISAQIPNPGFENWTAGDPDGWASSNIIPAGLNNITQTTDKHSGSSALRGEVVNFLTQIVGPVIQSGPGGTGFAITEQYLSFDLWYKFTSVGGDKFSVNVILWKGGTPIANGAEALPANVSSYTHLIVPLTYTTNEVPDLAIIQLSITGPVTGNDVHPGSVMFMDDLNFSLVSGTENIPVSDVTGKCYPNPVADILTIRLDENISGDCLLTVLDASGKVVKKIACNPQSFGSKQVQFSVKDLSPGIYFYSLNASNSRYNGKFSVNR